MSAFADTAVEVTKRDDSLDIWVDANNNGKRDDDDVNIYVTAGGGFYTVSPTFKHALDTAIQGRIKELAVAWLKEGGENSGQIQVLRELALDLVVKAQGLADAQEKAPLIAPAPPPALHGAASAASGGDANWC
jgi:hypothetical protein